MRTFIMVVQTIIAILLIVVVMMQPSKTNGLSGFVAGGSGDSFYSKNKGRTSEAMLSRLTAIFAIIFAGLCILQNFIK